MYHARPTNTYSSLPCLHAECLQFEDICEAARISEGVKNPYRTILRRRYWPQLTISVLIPIFQQLTGINAIMCVSVCSYVCPVTAEPGSTVLHAPECTCVLVLMCIMHAALFPTRRFYAPQLFEAAGQGRDGAMLATVITGAVNVGSTIVAIVLVDRVGRRVGVSACCCSV